MGPGRQGGEREIEGQWKRRTVMREGKSQEKQELVILLAGVCLKSLSGLHKVDDGDGLPGATGTAQSGDAGLFL